MKRDWDVIREVMVKLEDLADTDQFLELDSFKEEEHFVASYHVALLLEAGLIAGQMHRGLGEGPVDFVIYSLTWEGHELLDAMRSETVWNKTKGVVAKQGLNMTFDIVKTLTTRYAMAMINGTPM